MSLFKEVSSYTYRQLTSSVKYAALQNGFRVLSENKEPVIGKDGSHKMFFCCHQKPSKCMFRLQYTKSGPNEPFRFYKGRDVHNHGFIEPIQLLKENSNITLSEAALEASLAAGNLAEAAQGKSGFSIQENSSLLQSLQ